MFLEIITPEKKLFSGETELVQLPGASGSFEVLMNHAPLISTLIAGKIKVKESDGSFTYFEINGGVVEVLNNNISVLVD
ncbi:MAG TPA: ATP synthase F1 subunit epsilon [Prolixibacteraceae bacterium]